MSESRLDAPNQQVVRPDGSAPWDEGKGGSKPGRRKKEEKKDEAPAEQPKAEQPKAEEKAKSK